ncbi:recombinase family protein [Halioxenophilus aromaticivorans]|uniref:Recombinase family protein n=2 Tax=Halioxenophilus aromaticivorans TaxID=1306992 RepID=A0AAV3U9T0_9ALTE
MDRQLAYAQQYAATHGYTLDESLTLKDEGLSAYHQQHIQRGALGVFLKAIEDGLVPPGSILILEGLDRLSRAEPIDAQALLSQIINAGITVVTASDGKHYNRDLLKANPMDLIYSVLVMIRAHEESATKAKRVKLSISRLCDKWQDGSYRGVIRNGKDPSWVKLVNDNPLEWSLVEDRVEALKLAIRFYIAGFGGKKVVDELNARGLSITGNPPRASHIYRLKELRSLIGEKQISVDGETYFLEGYYPSILSSEEFAELQVQRKNRARTVGQKQIVNIVTGMGITYCGYCGSSVNSQNLMTRAKADGTLNDGHRRVQCCRASQYYDCPANGSSSVVPIEKALLEYCSDQMAIGDLLAEKKDELRPIKAELIAVETKIDTNQRKVQRLIEALEEFGEESPRAIASQLRQLEGEEDRLITQKQELESELLVLGKADQPDLREEWAKIKADVGLLDTEARMKVRNLVLKSFSRIEVFVKGIDGVEQDGIAAEVSRALLVGSDWPYEDNKNPIDLILRFRSGQIRVLRIHRKSGEWFAVRDVNVDSLVKTLS